MRFCILLCYLHVRTRMMQIKRSYYLAYLFFKWIIQIQKEKDITYDTLF